MSLFCVQSDARFHEFQMHLCDSKQAFQQRQCSLAGAGRAFTAAVVHSHCETHCVNLTTAVGSLLNATIALFCDYIYIYIVTI